MIPESLLLQAFFYPVNPKSAIKNCKCSSLLSHPAPLTP